MRVKRNSDGTSDVKVFGLCPEMIFAYIIAYEVYRELGNEENCVLTSARDGTHKRSSDHYMGNAIDLRVWGFKEITLDVTPECNATGEGAADLIRERLTDEYEVFFEGNHIHIGFDIQTLKDNG